MDIAYHLHIDARQQDELTVDEWEQAVQAVIQIRAEYKKNQSN